MLLPVDQAALRGSRLLPNASNAIAAVASIRAATVDLAQYMILPPNVATICLSTTFTPKTLKAGTQIRFRLFGSLTNAGVSQQAFVPVLRVTQAASVQTIGFLEQTSSGSPIAWDIEAIATVSLAGAARARIPGVNRYSSSQRVQNGGQSGLCVGGLVKVLQSGSSYNVGTSQAGGNLVASPTGTTASAFAATIDPNNNLLATEGPDIGVSLEITPGADVTVAVQGGWMEVLG